MYEYTTLEEAKEALEAAFSDVRGDNPDLMIDEIAFDVIVSVGQFCAPDVREEFYRTELGYTPGEEPVW